MPTGNDLYCYICSCRITDEQQHNGYRISYYGDNRLVSHASCFTTKDKPKPEVKCNFSYSDNVNLNCWITNHWCDGENCILMKILKEGK